MKVLGTRILIEQAKTATVSKGGIDLTATTIQPLPYGWVRQVGPLVCKDYVKVGNVVLFSEIGAIPLGVKENHVLIEPDDILAILEEGEY